MVRSHIGNVVCRKALCVRVASSPPKSSIRIYVDATFLVMGIDENASASTEKKTVY